MKQCAVTHTFNGAPSQSSEGRIFLMSPGTHCGLGGAWSKTKLFFILFLTCPYGKSVNRRYFYQMIVIPSMKVCQKFYLMNCTWLYTVLSETGKTKQKVNRFPLYLHLYNRIQRFSLVENQEAANI